MPPSLTAAGVVGSGGGAAGIGALYFTATHAAVSVSSAACTYLSVCCGLLRLLLLLVSVSDCGWGGAAAGAAAGHVARGKKRTSCRGSCFGNRRAVATIYCRAVAVSAVAVAVAIKRRR